MLKKDNSTENFPAGILGAVLGAILGSAAIIIVSQMGFVSAICGVILSICVLKGYELMSGGFSIKGLIVCLILVIATPYLADRLDWAIIIVNEIPEIPLLDAFRAVPELVEMGSINKDAYLDALLKLYLFVGLGAVSLIITAFRKVKA